MTDKPKSKLFFLIVGQNHAESEAHAKKYMLKGEQWAHVNSVNDLKSRDSANTTLLTAGNFFRRQDWQEIRNEAVNRGIRIR